MPQIFSLVFRLAWLLAVGVACAVPQSPSPGDPHAELRPRVQPSEPALANIRQVTFSGRRSGEGYFRVALTVDEERLAEGAARLGRLV